MNAALKLNRRAQAEPFDAPDTARRILKLRRTRDRLFPRDLFGDPAWDMLLDLYVSSQDGRPVSVSDACVASAVPATTALRWLTQMEKCGLVVRHRDVQDRRRIFVELTPCAIERLQAVLRALTD